MPSNLDPTTNLPEDTNGDTQGSPKSATPEGSPKFADLLLHNTVSGTPTQTSGGITGVDVKELLSPQDVSKAIQAKSDPHHVSLIDKEELRRDTDWKQLMATSDKRFQQARIARMEQLDAEQTWGSAGAGIGKFLGKVLNRTVLGLGGTIYGMGKALFTWDANAIVNNGIFETSENIDKALDDALPIYTNEDEYYKKGFFEKIFSHDFEKVMGDEVADGLSFAASAVFQELLLSAATGLTAGATAGAQAAATARLGKQASSMFGKYGQAYKTLKTLRGLDKTAEGTKMLATLAKNSKEVANIQKLQAIGGTARGLMISSNYEAAMEARGTEEELREKMLAEYREVNGTEATGKDLENIEDAVNAAKWSVYGANMAILGGSNLLQFSKIFWKGYSGQRQLLKQYGKNIVQDAEGQFVSKLAKEKGIKKGSKYLFNIVGRPVVEAAEEASQGIVNNTALEYWSRKYSADHNKESISIADAFGRGAEEFFSSPDGSTAMGVGFLIGALGVPIHSRMLGAKKGEGKLQMAGGIWESHRNFRDKRQNIQTMADRLNSSPDALQSLKNNYENFVTATSIQEDLDRAVEDRDIHTYKNLEHDQYFSYVNSRVKADMFEIVEDDLNKMREMDLETFNQEFGAREIAEFDEDQKEKVIDKALAQAQKIKEYSDLVEKIVDNKKVDSDIAAYTKDYLVHAASTMENTDIREAELSDRLTEITGIDPAAIDEMTKKAFYYNSIERLSKLATKKSAGKALDTKQQAEFNKLKDKLGIDTDTLNSLIESGDAIDYNRLREIVGEAKDLTLPKSEHLDQSSFIKAAEESISTWKAANPGKAAIHGPEINDLFVDIAKLKNRRETFAQFYNYLLTPEGGAEFAKLTEAAQKKLQESIEEEENAKQENRLNNAETNADLNYAQEQAGGISPNAVEDTNRKIRNKANTAKKNVTPYNPADPRGSLMERYESNPELYQKEVEGLKNLLDERMDFGFAIDPDKGVDNLVGFVEAMYSERGSQEAADVIEEFYANVTNEVADEYESDNEQADDPETADDADGKDLVILGSNSAKDYFENPMRGAAKEYEMDLAADRWFVRTDREGNPIPTENFLGVDWDYVNSSETLKEGQELSIEIDLEKVFGGKNDFHNKIAKQGKFEEGFHVKLVAKDKEGKPHTVAGLAAKKEKVQDKANAQANQHMLDVRRAILNELRAANIIDSNNKLLTKDKSFTSKLNTSVVSKGAGRININRGLDTFEKALPLSEVLGEGESITLGIGTLFNNQVVLSVPNSNISVPHVDGLVAGAVYGIVKSSNGEHLPVRLKTRKVTEGELLEVRDLLTEMDTKSGDKNEWIPVKEKLNSIVYADVYPATGRPGSFVIKQKNDKWSAPVTADDLVNALASKRAQVSLSKINTGEYNNEIDGDKIRTSLNAVNHTHSATITFNPIALPKDKKVENTTVSSAIDETMKRLGVQKGEAEKQAAEWAKESNVEFESPAKRPLKLPSDKGNLRTGKKNLGKSNNKGKFKHADDTITEVWDRKEELAWLKRNLKNVPVSVVQDLSTIEANGGNIAWGLFKNAAIYIKENAGAGTTYHEAFHAVFNLYLTEKQKSDLLIEAQAKSGLQTDEELEEWLADEFATYVQTQVPDKSFKGRINKFFSRLWNFMGRITGKQSYTIDRMFRAINDGNFKNKKLKGLDGVKNIKDVVRWKIPGMNPMQKVNRIDMVNYYVLDYVEDVMFKNKELTAQEAINSVGIPTLYESAYNQIYSDLYEPAAEDLDKNPTNRELEYRVRQLETTLTSLLEEVNEEGTKFGPLFNEAVRALRKHHIKIKTPTLNETEEAMAFMEEEGNTFEAWQVARASISTKDTTTFKVKHLLSKLDAVQTDDQGNLEAVNDDIGFPKMLDFDRTFNEMKYLLTEHYSLDEMRKSLSDNIKFKPHYAEILEEIDSNPEFASALFHSMSTQRKDYMLILESRKTEAGGQVSNVKFNVINSNRRSPERVLLNEWNSLFQKNLVNSKGEVDTKAVTNLKSKLEDTISAIKAKDSKELSGHYASKIADILNTLGIDVSSSELKKAYTSTADFVNMFEGKGILNTAIASMEKGNNPYAFGKQGERKSLTPFVSLAVSSRPAVYEQSSMNVENKQVYANISPNHSSKLVTQLKEGQAHINFLQRDKFYRRNKWLNDLKIKENKEIFSRATLNGIKDAKASRGVKYTSMSPFDRKTAELNFYINNNNKDWGYYTMPILADAPQMELISFKKYNTEEVLDAMVDVAKQEIERNSYIETKKPGIKNFEAGFYYIGGLENVDTNEEGNIREHIKAMLEGEIKRTTQQLVDLGIVEPLNEEGDLLVVKGLPSDTGFGNPTEFIKDYVYNHTLANIQMLQIFSGDTAFYKSEEDLSKRNKQVSNPGNLLNVEVMSSPTYNTIYLEDETFTSKFIKDYEEMLKDHPQRDQILAQYTQTETSKGVEQTDAQAYISLDRYRDVMKGAGLWTSKHESAYPDLKAGKATKKQLALVLQPIKPFMYSKIIKNGKIIPTQNKNSEFLLLPQMAKGNPKLEKLMDVFETGIQSIQFNSAVKVGEHNTLKYSDISGLKGSELETATVGNKIELSNEDYRIQLATPEHHIDTTILMGTQIRKLILADLVDDPAHKYDVGGKDMSSKELFDIFQEVTSMNVEEDYKELAVLFQPENRAKLQGLLIEEIRDRGLGQKYIDALELDEKGEFKFPLYFPLSAKRNESLLNSLFKNRVTKQKIKGGSFVQVSDFGLSDKLDVTFETVDGVKRVKAMEAMLPWWSKRYFPTNEAGEVDITKIPASVRELVGFRIPTEAKYSMPLIKVVGFTPKEAGGVAILPSDITKTSGSDFDIDKLFIMMPEFTYDKELKTINKVPSGTDTKAARNNLMIDVIKGVLSDPAHFGEAFTPGGFESLKSNKDRINSYYKKSSRGVKMMYPSSQLELFKRNIPSIPLRGVFVNHNNNHAMLQHTNVGFASEVKFENKASNELYLKETIERNPENISANLAEFVAASVDNAKDPVLSDLNINLFTADVAAVILRAGYNLETALDFINQPVIREYSERFVNRGSKDYLRGVIFMDLVSELESRKEGLKFYPGMAGASFEGVSMRQAMKKGFDNANPELQLYVLATFMKYKNMGDSLANLVDAMRADSKGAGPTMAANEVFLNKREKALEDDRLTGVENIFIGDKYPVVKAFTDYGLVKPNTKMAEYFPWSNTPFKKIKQDLAQDKGDDLTEREIEFINYSLLSFVGSDFEFYNMNKEELTSIVKDFPSELSEAIEGDEFLQSNIFTGNLTVETPDRFKDSDVKFDRIVFNNTARLSDIQKQQIDEVFEYMLENPKYRDLAEKLIKYSFATSGFTFTPNSFNHLIPISFYNNLRDSSGQTFYDFLKQEIDGNKDVVDAYPNFKYFFFSNYYDKFGFVPRIEIADKEDMNVHPEDINYDDTAVNPISLVVDPAKIARKNLFTVDPETKLNVYKPVIKLEIGGETSLFYLHGMDALDRGIYYRLPRLGKENYVMEINKDRTNRGSVLEENVINFDIGGYSVPWGSGSIARLKARLEEAGIDSTKYITTLDSAIDSVPNKQENEQIALNAAYESMSKEEQKLKKEESNENPLSQLGEDTAAQEDPNSKDNNTDCIF